MKKSIFNILLLKSTIIIRTQSHIVKKHVLIVLFFFFYFQLIFSHTQLKKVKGSIVFVDGNGIMRWVKDSVEVALFGVNYTVPFAHTYRGHQYLGISHKTAIDQDIYHMARLGFNAFRVHVWDCEISDSTGNLLENDHLELFDYQIMLMKERGIKMLITPIAYWQNGYPESSQKTPGFSTKYGKDDCLTNPEAIRAQENYLSQFVNHINKYTGIAYKNDPDIIAFEISNEPHHNGTKEDVTSFINKMSEVIRNTGCTKPVFYNTSHSIHLAEAYYNSDIQGGTFQWYPTNLVHGHEIKGNFLPNVNDYIIPFSDLEGYKKATRVVYEFDAADIGRSYIYPYMVKSLKEAGMQFINHFSYDPLHMAYANTEYTTHYMNLAYAPQKALSLMISGEVCRIVPLYRDYGNYPDDMIFGPFRVNYEQDLAEMVTSEKFIYTNNTKTRPPDIKKLTQIAGFGNSPIVKYEGTGSYFLDKIENGVWRLEVMPDAVWVRDPFEHASLKKEVSVIIWNEWPIDIDLPDLGQDYMVIGINKGNSFSKTSNVKTINITPGTYLLVNKKKNYKPDFNLKIGNIKITEFVAPSTSLKQTYVLHESVYEVETGRSLKISAQIISVDKPESVELFIYGEHWKPEKILMQKRESYTYETIIPGEKIHEGFLRYLISVKQNGIYTTYPEKLEGLPVDWDFYGNQTYYTRIVNSNSNICLFNADEDADNVYGNTWYKKMPSIVPGEETLIISTAKFDNEIPEHAVRFFFGNKIIGRKQNLKLFDTLVIEAYSPALESLPLQVVLVLNNGSAFAVTFHVTKKNRKYQFALKDMEKIPLINLPNSYPTFLSRYFNGCNECAFDINKIESVQFSLGPGLTDNEKKQVNTIAIEKAYLK